MLHPADGLVLGAGPPGLPLSGAGWVFAVLMAVVLLAPIAAERARLPGIIGLVLAGTLVGPGVLGLLERDGAIALIGGAGLLYLMFAAGLELDLDGFVEHRRDSLVFGGATFAVPMLLGTLSAVALGYPLLAAILIASCWASHTLVSYPEYQRFGTTGNRAVATTVGATIITDTAALLVLAVVARAHQGALDARFWLALVPSLAGLAFVTMWVLPRLARWFFAGIGHDRETRFLFLMVGLFASAGLAEAAGIEAIVGAFLAGLALNRLVPNDSALMTRVEFLGAVFLIPLFLVSIGMIVDLRMLVDDPRALLDAVVFTAVALGAKWLAATLSGRAFGYVRSERATMFSLSSAQAAATLAAVFVGLEVGLLEERTVNAVIVVILATCLVSSWLAARHAPVLPRPDARPDPLGARVVVPVARPDTADHLVELAATLAAADSGAVLPLAVMTADADQEHADAQREGAAALATLARRRGVEADGVVRIDASVATGIAHTLVEHHGTMLVIGWKGYATRREDLFGGVIDAVLPASTVPTVVARLGSAPVGRLVLVVSESSLTPAGRSGLDLAYLVVQRLAGAYGVGVTVLTDAGGRDRDEMARILPDAEVVHDDRRPAVAVRPLAAPSDMIVVPTTPGRASLRGAASRIARAVPASSVLVVLDPTGHQRAVTSQAAQHATPAAAHRGDTV